ncbi:MAG: hypothetical protein IKB56_02000, partial [Clostridia bacterium]|nr:hypothetical protein [Clostridia bacterium]
MKNAKKSMFITTILMVAVLIVAVSTATFAWYTTTTAVSASQATVKSASSESADIAIDWVSASTSTAIVLEGGPAIQPMAPTAAVTADTKKATMSFNTAPVDLEGNFTAAGATTAPWALSHTVTTGEEPDQVTNTYTSFYVINNNYNEATSVKMTATFGGTLADNLCVAVFVGNDILGVFAKNDYEVGAITEGGTLTTCDFRVDPTDATDNYLTIADIAARGNAEISVYAWIDGVELTSVLANQEVATFSFSFA